LLNFVSAVAVAVGVGVGVAAVVAGGLAVVVVEFDPPELDAGGVL
jgi:hypothetical protein